VTFLAGFDFMLCCLRALNYNHSTKVIPTQLYSEFVKLRWGRSCWRMGGRVGAFKSWLKFKVVTRRHAHQITGCIDVLI